MPLTDQVLEIADRKGLNIRTASAVDLMRAIASNEQRIDSTDRVAEQIAATTRHQRRIGAGSFNV